QFGTRLIGTGFHAYATDNTTYDIRHLADQFAKGYDEAYTGVNPTKCPAVSGPRQTIYLAIATSNDQQGSNVALTADHAAAWAQMVDKVTSDVSYIEGIVVEAGIDAEPNFDTAYSHTADWVNSYSTNGHTLCHDFGSTDGYPDLAPGEPTPVVSPPWGHSSWSVDEFYNIARGISGQRPLPEIYKSSYARDWYRVKRWSQTRPIPLTFPMDFEGVMSECYSSGCQPPADFSEQQAWQVFWLELNADQITQQDIPYSTDIRCSNGPYAGCSPSIHD
ncbi:MAG TPA: hypothetical protein VFM49_11110, partial [Chloroflexia bacterium]|nr:hypothetical protein [Chloroflexia bacterium]